MSHSSKDCGTKREEELHNLEDEVADYYLQNAYIFRNIFMNHDV
jgi:hypothetical protein